MKLSKSLGAELYRLFGPNGSDECVGRNETNRLKVFFELERHGIVKLAPRGDGTGIFDVKRQVRGLASKS